MYFNPRSHERSDKLFVAVKVWYPIFQSTLPREERQENGIEYDDLLDISIHAPTRGATISNGLCDGFYAIFQSTLPREERLVAKDFTEGMVVFQSTLPREERRNHTHALTASICQFQSTLPREERLIFRTETT